jgi:hypothetical protein
LEVLRHGVTHSTRVATVDFRNDPAKQLEWAVREMARRDALIDN